MLAAFAASVALPMQAGGKHFQYGNGAATRVITVSCYRGPLQRVIWDRPQPAFIDSLVAVGYDYPTAHAIGERVCRDQSLVNNPGSLSRTMREIYYAAPVYR